MTDNVIEPKADAQGDKLDAIMSLLGKTITRLDDGVESGFKSLFGSW